MCMQVNMCQSLRVARSSSCSPPLEVCKGLKAEDGKQIYPLASWSETVKTKDTDRIFKSQNPNDLSQPHSPPHLPSLPSCFLRESRARRCLLKSILYLQWGFGIKQAETGWLNAGDAIIRLNLEYTSLQFVWWEHFLQNNESPGLADRDRHREREKETEIGGEIVREIDKEKEKEKERKREIIVAQYLHLRPCCLPDKPDKVHISLIANTTQADDSESVWLYVRTS